MSKRRGQTYVTPNPPRENSIIGSVEIDPLTEEIPYDSLEIFDFSDPLPPKEAHVFRLYYNNCNGLEINHTAGEYIKQKQEKKKHNYIKDIEVPTKVDGILRQMKAWEVDVVSLAEICVAWEETVPRRVIQQITKKYDKHACWTVASSSIKVGSYLKPGGTGILTLGNNTGRMIDRGSDPWKMGRWTYCVISGGRRRSSILLVTGYRTGKRSSQVGAKTAWMQQQTMLIKDKRTEPPHVAFLTDLSQWLKQYVKSSMEVVICLDANEQWSQNSDIKKFAEEFSLINVNMEMGLKPSHPNLANISRSTNIDYCLCSMRVYSQITNSTSAPYDLENLGDHRGFILDINLRGLFGEELLESNHTPRKLVLSNPKAVEKYLREVEKKFSKQNIYQRSYKLLNRVVAGQTDVNSIMTQYERIDRDVHGICTNAEKRCKPSFAGNHEWSPVLARAIKTLNYWRQRLKHRSETTLIQHMGAQINMPYTQLSEDTIHQLINDSKQTLKAIQERAREHRKDHLEELATSYANQHSMSTQRAVVELVAHEEARNIFNALRNQLKPRSNGGLSTLWVAKDDTGKYTKNHSQKVIHTDRDAIHNEILKRNAKHLQQASSTPFAKGRLRRELKWDGTGPLAEKILTGDILNEHRFSSAMQLYLESLKVNDLSRLNTIRPNLLLEDYQNFWKKKRESTVTSPFGLHIGHYKAATQNLKILEVHRRLLVIPFQIGLVPRRWRRTVQTMLEKEPGAPWIHRLRIIELFDAQANAGFQIFVGRRMMRQAVDKNLLSAESFGSTPGKMAVSAILQKTVSMDQLRIERRAGGLFDCDATGCYDRILPPVASVHLRALGLAHSIGTFLSRLMYKAKRYARTGGEVSKKNIATKRNAVLHGIGQGNGGGPAMWIAHLTIMFAALSSVCVGFVMTCVTNIKKVTSVGTGYVDDVTLGLSLPRDEQQTEHMVHKKIKQMSQLWERLLYITGGKLELSKCFWIPIAWKWKKGKPILIIHHTREKHLELRESESRKKVVIPRKTGKDVEKRLGVLSSCDGKWSREFQNWIEFSRAFGNKMKISRLGRMAGYLAYQSIWLAKFRYSAPVTGLTFNQLDAIQKAITSPCLSVAGYCSKFPRAVVFGPQIYGGLSWNNIEVVLIFEKLKMLIGSIRLQDTVGRMLELQLTWIQLFVGTSVPFLEANRPFPYLPDGWLHNLQNYLLMNEITVEIYNTWVPRKQRSDDRVLMDIVMKHIPSGAWKGINNCRLFLQATTVADITTLDGRYVPSMVRKVQAPLRTQTLIFPFQKRPSKTDRAHWNLFLDVISQNGHLYLPLGAWLRHPDQRSEFMYCKESDAIYKQTGKQWEVFGRQNSGRRRYRRVGLAVSGPPCSSLPVQAIAGHGFIIKMASNTQNTGDQITTQTEYFTQNNTVRNPRGQFTVVAKQMDFLQARWHQADCKLICATDGGLKDKMGTSSYVIFHADAEDPIVEGFEGEYQPLMSASSTRQELLGQLGVEKWLEKLKEKWGVPRHRLKLVLITDSQASIDIMVNAMILTGIKDTLRAEMDVALELKRLQSMHWWVDRQVVKVESHIDSSQAPDIFAWECNNRADYLATKARDILTVADLKKNMPRVAMGTKAICKIDGAHVNNDLYCALQDKITGTKMKLFLLEKYGWSESVFDSICWEAHRKELEQYPLIKRVTLLKYIHGWLATKKRRFREGYFKDSLCPLCGEDDSTGHFLHCKQPQIREIRDHRWKLFCAAVECHTPGGCRQVFLAGLGTLTGFDPPTQETIHDWPKALQVAYTEQDDIGWDQILKGRLSKSWEVVAQRKVEGSRHSGSYTWIRRMIRLGWRYGMDMWLARNELVHGPDGQTSSMELKRTIELIKAVYRELLSTVTYRRHEVFRLGEDDMLRQTYQSQIAWLEQLKFLYKERYIEIEAATVGKLKSDQFLGEY